MTHLTRQRAKKGYRTHRRSCCLSTVGLIRKLPHHLVSAFKATLEELAYADLLLHVVDVSDEDWEQQAETVEKVVAQLGAQDIPRVMV